MDEENNKTVAEQIESGELSINIKPPPEYIKHLVFQAMIPTQKKYMKATLTAFCTSCEHCDYCPVKTASTKCQRFHRFFNSYIDQIKDTVL